MSEFVLNRTDADFPDRLREIPDPPKHLYGLGDRGLLRQTAIALVGTRQATEYGRKVAWQIARRTADAGIVIVGGLASGIDAAGHRGALSAPGGRTIAILGCGPDICYPAVNRQLYRQIVQNGLILSEYPPGTPPRAFRFPERNRLISGLGQVVVVVEADLRSGSLITAARAIEQNRDVLAVPGNITSPQSRGTNQLIRDGAWPLLSAEGVLEYCSWPVVPAAPVELSQAETEVWRLVLAADGIGQANLAARYAGPPGQLAGLLTVLELKGLIKISGGKIYIAKC